MGELNDLALEINGTANSSPTRLSAYGLTGSNL
jgi:hypothetical protein